MHIPSILGLPPSLLPNTHTDTQSIVMLSAASHSSPPICEVHLLTRRREHEGAACYFTVSVCVCLFNWNHGIYSSGCQLNGTYDFQEFPFPFLRSSLWNVESGGELSSGFRGGGAEWQPRHSFCTLTGRIKAADDMRSFFKGERYLTTTACSRSFKPVIRVNESCSDLLSSRMKWLLCSAAGFQSD